jgi:hypothetical protein
VQPEPIQIERRGISHGPAAQDGNAFLVAARVRLGRRREEGVKLQTVYESLQHRLTPFRVNDFLQENNVSAPKELQPLEVIENVVHVGTAGHVHGDHRERALRRGGQLWVQELDEDWFTAL